MPHSADASSLAPRWRRIVAWVLVVVATILVVVSSLTVWVKRQALSTENWTNASTRLLENDDVRNALSIYLVDQLYANVDVQARLEQRLPPRLKPLAAPLAGGLQNASYRAADNLLASEQAQTLWKEANRRAHTAFLAVVEGDESRVNEEVLLDLQPILQKACERTGVGCTLQEELPAAAGQLRVLRSNQVETVQTGVRVVKALSVFLSLVVLALYAGAVALARGRRRRMILASGAGILLAGLVVLVVRRLTGQYLEDALTNTAQAERAVSVTWAIGTELLRNIGINLVVYGSLIVAAGWLVGPARFATAIRRWLAPTLAHRPIVVYAVVALVLLVLLATGPTDWQRLAPLLVILALAFVGVEVLRRMTAREFPAARMETEAPG